MSNMAIYNAVRTVPDNAKKTIGAGRLKGMTDINPMWRIQALTEQFGPVGIGWYYKTIRKWIEDGADGVKCAFVDIELYYRKDNGEWSMPVEGTGGSAFIAKESKGFYTSDEAYKMALTDAISVACKALGFGADVYWAGGRTKYNQKPADEDPFPDVNDNVSEDKVKQLEAIYTVFQKEHRETFLKLMNTKYKIKSLSDLNTQQFVKYREELLAKAEDAKKSRLENMVSVFAQKSGKSVDEARQVIELCIGKSISDVMIAEFHKVVKEVTQMIEDLGA